MPATCPNCGRGIGRGDQFCDGCGAFLGWAEGESAESQLLPQGATQRDDQRAAVQFQLKSDLINVAPGNAESTSFTVKNLGTQVEEFRFFVTGPEWIAVEPAALSVYPGQEATGAVQAAPPRSPSSVAGVTPYRLTATSALHANVSGSVAGRVDVAPYYDLAAELVPTSSNGRGLTRHHIRLDNRGNVPLRVGLSPADVADGLRLGLPAFADVPPGRVIEVPVSVYGSRRWFGRPETKTFSVIAEVPKPLAATRLSGTRTVLPLFPRWVPVAAAGLVAVVAAGTTVIPKLIGHPVPIQSHSNTPGGGGSTTPGGGGAGSTTPGGGGSTTPVQQVPPVGMIPEASSSATWTSFSSAGQPSLQVGTNTGCRAGAAGAGQGAVLTVQQAVLQDGTQASTALETDPPTQPFGHLVGVYAIPATKQGEVFRAEVGFCWGVASGAQVTAEVRVGSAQQPAAWSQTLTASNGPLTSVNVSLPTGTTQISLEVMTPQGAPASGDVVWVDPFVEGANAPSPSPRPTVTQ